MTLASSANAFRGLDMIAELRPKWLRPTAFGAAFLAHASVVALFLVAKPEALAPSTSDAFNISYVKDGESLQAANADSAPDELSKNEDSAVEQEAAEAQQAEAPTAKVREAWAALALPKAEVESADAIPVPLVEKPAEEPKPTFEHRPEQKPNEAAQVQQTLADGKVLRQATAAQEASAAAAASAERVGAAEGKFNSNQMSKARYGARLLAEIQKHMFYPPQARNSGVKGHATVAFVVGAEGRVIERQIMRSSGDPTLDNAALAMVDAVQAPPPPAGRFHGKTTVRFDIRH